MSALPASAFQPNGQNYYSLESNFLYMSVSQYKDFRSCPAMAMAKLTGEWYDEPSDALVVGSYVHAAFESEEAFAKFIEQNESDIFNKKKEKYAAFKQADKMIETLQNDPFAIQMLEGQKETIITAQFAGVTWKAKLDVLHPERIVDIKTVRSIRDKHWDVKDRQYVSFIEAYNYHTQLAVYSELERIVSGRNNRLDAYIVAVSKEDVPDKVVIGFDAETVEVQLDMVKHDMEWIQAVKDGTVEAHRCETCKYCRETKQLSGVIHYKSLVV